MTISTNKWSKLSVEDKLAMVDDISSRARRVFKLKVTVLVKSNNSENAEKKLRKLLRGNYMNIKNLINEGII